MGRKPIGAKAMTPAERKARMKEKRFNEDGGVLPTPRQFAAKARQAKITEKRRANKAVKAGHPAVKTEMTGSVFESLGRGLPSRRDWGTGE